MKGRRVVVTGVGAVTPLGNTATAFWDGLITGRSGIRPHPNVELGSVGWVDMDFSKLFSHREISMTDRITQMAIVAADEAMTSARMNDGLGERGGVFLGVALGGSETITSEYGRHFGTAIGNRKPFPLVAGMPNAACANLAIRFAAKGEWQNYATACSSSAVAIGEAFRRLRDGYLDVALVGGTENFLVPALLDAWKPMRVMCADPPSAPGTGCRPFSADRSGFALGEGAAVFTLETLEGALHRGATPLCEIVGYGLSSDATHMTNPDSTGQIKAMTMALQEACIEPSQIDHVNAHGTATKNGDKVEAQSIKGFLGRRAYEIPISATKSAHGHLMGATSAVEFVAAVHTLRDQIVPPTTFWTAADDDCDLDFVPRIGRREDVEHLMFNSLAFGGSNVVLVAKRMS